LFRVGILRKNGIKKKKGQVDLSDLFGGKSARISSGK
jgi:hypothetical protein